MPIIEKNNINRNRLRGVTDNLVNGPDTNLLLQYCFYRVFQNLAKVENFSHLSQGAKKIQSCK